MPQNLFLTPEQKHYIDMYASTKLISEMSEELKVPFRDIFHYIHYNEIHHLFYLKGMSILNR